MIAGSYSQTYLRNAINNGFVCVESPQLVDAMREAFAARDQAGGAKTVIGGDTVALDFARSMVVWRDREYRVHAAGHAGAGAGHRRRGGESGANPAGAVNSPAPVASGRAAVVWTVAFTNFALPFMFSGVGVAAPAMGRDLAMSGAALGLFETLYLGTAAALMLPAGRIGDAGDKNSLFTLGAVIFAATTLALAFLPTVPLLLAVRVVQGIAAALIAATNMALLTEVVPRERLGRAIGLNIGAVYVGLSAGPFVAGTITTALGWRWVFGISGLMAAGAAVLAVTHLPRRWRWPRLRFDWPGTATSAAAVVLLLVGSAAVGEGSLGWWLLGAGLVILTVFFFIEARIDAPLISVRALAERPVLLRALVVQFLTYAGAMGTAFLFSLYLQVARGWQAREAGWLLVIAPVLMASLAPVAGRLADRVRPQLHRGGGRHARFSSAPWPPGWCRSRVRSRSSWSPWSPTVSASRPSPPPT